MANLCRRRQKKTCFEPHVKCPVFLSGRSQIWIFSTYFHENSQYRFFWVILSLWATLLHVDRRNNLVVYNTVCGPGSSVGIETGYGLDVPRIESRWGARFSAPVQTAPWGPSILLYMGTGSFRGVKSGRCVTLTPHSLLLPWSRKSRAIPLLPLPTVRLVQSLSACTVQLYLYSPYGPYGLYRASVPVQ